MSIVYFDTSALVKRYIAEIGSDWVKTLLENQAPTVFTSLLTAKKAPVLLLAASVRECCRQRIITNS